MKISQIRIICLNLLIICYLLYLSSSSGFGEL